MKIIRNQGGIALITALLFTFLAMVIIIALLYIVNQGTKVSAANKRYKSALEASYGGAEVFTKMLIPQMMGSSSLADMSSLLAGNTPNFGDADCLKDKLELPPAKWTHCAASAKLVDPKDTFDAQFTLKGQPGQPNFNVYAKIVDTQPGNSDTSGLELDSASGVASGASGVSPQHIPANYRIEVQGERATNPQEKGALSVLYVY